VTAILLSQGIFVGSSPSVTCVATFDGSVDLPLNIIIIFGILGDHEKTIDSGHSVHMGNYMRYTRTFTIDNIQANLMGTCSLSPAYGSLELSEFILDNQMDLDIANVYIAISKWQIFQL
jgi:hypothetical protein